LLPNCGPLPQISQTCAMVDSESSAIQPSGQIPRDTGGRGKTAAPKL
jgi:hypothetical protein